MANVKVNISEEIGKIKIMHAVNNGPIKSRFRGNSVLYG